MSLYYAGIDVQLARPCVSVVVDEVGNQIQSCWFKTAGEIFQTLEPLSRKHQLHVGIDAPRLPLTNSRKWYWNGSKNQWRKKTAAEKGLGRHCEVVIKAQNLANPQWTPEQATAPGWMKLGFELFQVLGKMAITHEVFPSASYTMLEDDSSVNLTINFSKVWKRGAGDLFDALMAAATVREFVEGRGCEVGGGDGLGTIILPRKIAGPISDVLNWPD